MLLPLIDPADNDFSQKLFKRLSEFWISRNNCMLKIGFQNDVKTNKFSSKK